MKKPIAPFCAFLFFCTAAAAGAKAQEISAPDGGLYWSVRGGLSQVRNLAIWDWGGYDALYAGTPPVLVSPGLDDHREFRSLEMNYGYVVGAAIGYTLAYPNRIADLRFEVEGIFRRNEDGEINSPWEPLTSRPDSVTLGFETVPVIGKMEVRSAMFNALVDFRTPSRFTPYVGVGGGISQLITEGYTFDWNRDAHGDLAPQIFNDDIYALSWQVIAGVGYRLSPGAMLTLEGRYFRLAADRWSDLFQTDELREIKFDDWSLGVRFTF